MSLRKFVLSFVFLAITPLATIAQPLDPLDFPSLGALNLSGGNFTFDTDALTIVDDSDPGTPLFTGIMDDQGGMAQPGVVPEIAVFAFDAINLDPTATVTITGTRAVALLSHTDAVIGTALSVDGKASGQSIPGGGPSPGGFAGGAIPTTSVSGLPGEGPGSGQPNVNAGVSIQYSGGMGGFGGAGVEYNTSSGPPGQPYGDLTQFLQGGSGGASQQSGGGGYVHGAGGGGAIEIAAVGTLRVDAPVSARGGLGQTFPFGTAGSGSGGGIRISGADVVLDALVSAPGGDNALAARSGGGGRVLIHGGPGIMPLAITPSVEFIIANIDVKSTTGPYNSNPGSPIVSRANQGVVTLSPNLTLVGDGETLLLGQAVDLSTPNENIELRHRDARFTVGATGDVGNGYTNQHLIELTHPTARIVGSGTLANQAELRGTGNIETLFSNAPGGQVNAVNDTLNFVYDSFNNPNAQVNAINSTLSFGTWLESTGEVNLINSTVHGDFINNGVASLAGTNTFTGTVSGVGVFTGTGTGSFAGTLAPANGTGALSFGGDVVLQPAATLAIEIGGTTPGVTYDQVTVDGVANLMGTLDVTLTDDFVPTLGDSFGFLSANGGFSSGFSSLNLPDISGLGLGWQLNPGGATIFLNVVSDGIRGDFDLDGDVDGRDFLAWQRNPSVGDLADWQANYGAGSLTAESSAIPESGSLALLIGLIVLRLPMRPIAITALHIRCESRFAGGRSHPGCDLL